MNDEKKWLSQIATPTISEVFERFLEEQRTRIKPATFRNYDYIIHFFKESMDQYAYLSLEKEEEELFNYFHNLEYEEETDFCDIFGPDKIVENVYKFLDYFMIRKVICGTGLLKAAGTVIKRLINWLAENGYVDNETAEEYAYEAGEASKELPAAEKLAKLLYQHAQDQKEMSFRKTIDGYFSIEKVEKDRLHLMEKGGKTFVVKLPEEITSKCTYGWSMYLQLGKKKDGWRILEVGSVYPN